MLAQEDDSRIKRAVYYFKQEDDWICVELFAVGKDMPGSGMDN